MTANVMSNKKLKSFESFIAHDIDRPSNCSFWLPHLYLLLDMTLAVLQIPASDYLICIFYWTLHWSSFKFELLITSFQFCIGHYIDRHSNSSFWLPHLYLLLDITLAVISEATIWRSFNVMSNKRYKWGNQKLECEGRQM
jgi:hypothetical protein